jgi:hypothetical protein
VEDSSVTALSEIARRRMPTQRHPWWRKVDDAELVRVCRPSTSLLDVGIVRQRRGAHEDSFTWRGGNGEVVVG